MPDRDAAEPAAVDAAPDPVAAPVTTADGDEDVLQAVVAFVDELVEGGDGGSADDEAAM